MRTTSRYTGRLLVPLAVTAALLAACTVQPEPVVTATVGAPNTVTYPEGRYQLYGDGAATPYYWVWIPAGAVPPPPPPPPRPGVVTYPGGRYQLYGDGSTTPYYWVWVPGGPTAPVVPPPPPPPPRRF
jgi:hypothetical protein